jgi:hypothetical protein
MLYLNALSHALFNSRNMKGEKKKKIYQKEWVSLYAWVMLPSGKKGSNQKNHKHGN